MTQRSFHLPIYTMLIGLLIISVGFNIISLGHLNALNKTISNTMPPVADQELHQMMKEVKRLSAQTYTSKHSDTKYDLKTKEPISNGF